MELLSTESVPLWHDFEGVSCGREGGRKRKNGGRFFFPPTPPPPPSLWSAALGLVMVVIHRRLVDVKNVAYRRSEWVFDRFFDHMGVKVAVEGSIEAVDEIRFQIFFLYLVGERVGWLENIPVVEENFLHLIVQGLVSLGRAGEEKFVNIIVLGKGIILVFVMLPLLWLLLLTVLVVGIVAWTENVKRSIVKVEGRWVWTIHNLLQLLVVMVKLRGTAKHEVSCTGRRLYSGPYEIAVKHHCGLILIKVNDTRRRSLPVEVLIVKKYTSSIVLLGYCFSGGNW